MIFARPLRWAFLCGVGSVTLHSMQCPFVSVVRFAKNFLIFVVSNDLLSLDEHI